jgi:hypothetical protein
MVDKTEITEPTLHPGVELLLARMKSNPEEFYNASGNYGRWSRIMNAHIADLTDEERDACELGLRRIKMDKFHKDVMNELLRDPKEESVVGSATAVPTYTGTANRPPIQPDANQLAEIQKRYLQQMNSAQNTAYGNSYPYSHGDIISTVSTTPTPKLLDELKRLMRL